MEDFGSEKYICNLRGQKIKLDIVYICLLMSYSDNFHRAVVEAASIATSLYYKNNGLSPYYLITGKLFNENDTKEYIYQALDDFIDAGCYYFIIVCNNNIRDIIGPYFDEHNIFGITLNRQHNSISYKHLAGFNPIINIPLSMIINVDDFDNSIIVGYNIEGDTSLNDAINVFLSEGYNRPSIFNMTDMNIDNAINEFISYLSIEYPNGANFISCLLMPDSIKLINSLYENNMNRKYHGFFLFVGDLEFENLEIGYRVGHYICSKIFNIDEFKSNSFIEYLNSYYLNDFKIYEKFIDAYYSLNFLLSAFHMSGVKNPQLLTDLLYGYKMDTVYGSIIYQPNAFFGTSYYIAKYNKEGKPILVSDNNKIHFDYISSSEEICWWDNEKYYTIFGIFNLPDEYEYLSYLRALTYYFNIHKSFGNSYVVVKVINCNNDIDNIINILDNNYKVMNGLGVISCNTYNYTELIPLLEEKNIILHIPFDSVKGDCHPNIINVYNIYFSMVLHLIIIVILFILVYLYYIMMLL